MFSFTGSVFTETSLILIFVAFVLTAHIIRQKPEGEAIEALSQEFPDLKNRLSALETDVAEIKRLLEE